tara:strand:- start:161 stop:490 length:330 start_codon:yes stop_codon:yes gene_type:complete
VKITKSQLKQIIKEVLENVKYVEPQEGETTPDDAEVLVKGLGVLTIGQVRERLLRDYLRELHKDLQGEVGDKDLLRIFDKYLDGGGLVARFKTLKAHNALQKEEDLYDV